MWTVDALYPEMIRQEQARAEQLCFWQPNDVICVLEDEAVTIPLS